MGIQILEGELVILRKLLPLLDFCHEGISHGEDCEFWDYEEESPSGEPCTCGTDSIRLILVEHKEFTENHKKVSV